MDHCTRSQRVNLIYAGQKYLVFLKGIAHQWSNGLKDAVVTPALIDIFDSGNFTVTSPRKRILFLDRS